MKTLKSLCLVVLVWTLSCSSDDDTLPPQVETGSFPTKITKSSSTNPTVNRSFNFTYNNDNQISAISVVFPEGEVYRTYDLSYNNGLLTQLDDGSIAYNFTYSLENKLNSITIGSGTEEITIPINYNPDGHTYNYALEGEGTMTMNADEMFPILFENDNPSSLAIGYTTIDGVFADVTPQVALQLTLSGFPGLDYFFFHPLQIQGLLYNGTEWTLTNTRDEEENIVTIVASSPFESYNYAIEYEEREL